MNEGVREVFEIATRMALATMGKKRGLRRLFARSVT